MKRYLGKHYNIKFRLEEIKRIDELLQREKINKKFLLQETEDTEERRRLNIEIGYLEGLQKKIGEQYREQEK